MVWALVGAGRGAVWVVALATAVASVAVAETVVSVAAAGIVVSVAVVVQGCVLFICEIVIVADGAAAAGPWR